MESDNQELDRLLREREVLLKRFPELRPMQDDIDEALKNAGSDIDARLRVMDEFIESFFNKKNHSN